MRAALLYPHLLHNPLRLAVPRQEPHVFAVNSDSIQATSKPPSDPLGLSGLDNPPEEQISPGRGDAAGHGQLERRISQAVDEQAEGRAFHFQKDRVPLSVAHKNQGGEVAIDIATASVSEMRHPVNELQNTPKQPELAAIQAPLCREAFNAPCSPPSPSVQGKRGAAEISRTPRIFSQ